MKDNVRLLGGRGLDLPQSDFVVVAGRCDEPGQGYVDAKNWLAAVPRDLRRQELCHGRWRRSRHRREEGGSVLFPFPPSSRAAPRGIAHHRRRPGAGRLMSARGLQALHDGFADDVLGPRRRKAPERFARGASPSPSPEHKRKQPRMPASSNPKENQKRTRCGECAACLTSNCGRCKFCRDMPKFGGTGTLRQPCINRLCEVMLASQREAKEAAAAVREEEREKRRAERETERAGRDAERDVKRLERDGLRRKERAEREAKQGVRKRIPTVSVGVLSGGWGEHTDLQTGAAVEVRLSEEGLDGSIYSGTLAQRAKGKAGGMGSLVVFDQLLEEGSEAQLLREWVQMQDVRRRPPPTPAGFARLVEAGDLVELYFEDGWWEVEVEKVQRLKPGEVVPQQHQEHEGGDEAPAAEAPAETVMHAAAPEGIDTAASGQVRAGAAEGCAESGDGAPGVEAKDAAAGDAAAGDEAAREIGGAGTFSGGGLCAEPNVILKAEGPDSSVIERDEQGGAMAGGVPKQEAEEPEAMGGGEGGKGDMRDATGEAVDAEAGRMHPSQGTSLDQEASPGALVFHVRSVKYKAIHYVDASRLRPLWLWSGPEALWRYEIEAGHGYATGSTLAGSEDDTKGSDGGREVVWQQGDLTTMFRFARGIPRSHNDGGSRAGVGTIYDALDHL